MTLTRPKRPLTQVELQMLQMAAQSRGNRWIAGELGTTEQVVKNRFSRIFDRMGVGDRAGAVAKALREGLIK